VRTEKKLLEKFDASEDGRLNAEERKAARESLAKDKPGRFYVLPHASPT
jgi:hypothetical protein